MWKRLKFILFFLTVFVSLACSYFGGYETKMERLGPDVSASLVIYFKLGTTEEQIEQFYQDYLFITRQDGRGEAHRYRIRTNLRLLPVQANNYDAIAVTFQNDATENQRSSAKDAFESSVIVYKVFENIAPNDINKSNLE